MVKQENKEISKLSNLEIGAHLLLPLAIVFLAISLCGSLIVSSLIIAQSIKQSGLSTNSTTATINGTPASTTTTTPAVTVTSSQIKGLFTANKYITFGDPNSKLLFVEFSDPSCPYCHVAGGHDPEVAKQFGTQFIYTSDGGTYIPPVTEMKKLVDSGKAAFAYIYTTGHGNGKLGMQALYCANDKGKFWQVHDLLMNNAGYNLLNDTVKNDVANSSKLADYLAPAIDKDFMKSCLQSGQYTTRVTTDEQSAGAFGVNGTPGFFVNTTAFNGAYSFKDMQPSVDAALK